MIFLPGSSRHSLLALIVILAQICLGFGASLNLRQNEGDSDSDSDDDETSESCRNGVCTTVTKGRGGQGSATQTGASASTQGPNKPNTQGNSNNPSTQSSNPNAHGNNHTKNPNGTFTTSGTLPTSGNPTQTGGSTANNNNNPNNNAAQKGGLRTGGIVGLVIGLSILAGLIAMFLLKRRNHLRQVRKRPRGSMLLPSKPASLQPDSLSSEMAHVPFNNPSIVSPDAVAAAHVRTVEGQPLENYGPLNVRADGTSTSYTPLLPIAQYSDSAPTRQATLHSNNHTNTADTSSFMGSLPSPQEITSPTSWGGAAAATSSSSSPSAIHSEMVAYQKALERDNEKGNQPSSSRTDMVDPPPVYTD